MIMPDNTRGTAPRMLIGFIPMIIVVVLVLAVLASGHPVLGIALAVVLVPVAVYLNYLFVRPRN